MSKETRELKKEEARRGKMEMKMENKRGRGGAEKGGCREWKIR